MAIVIVSDLFRAAFCAAHEKLFLASACLVSVFLKCGLICLRLMNKAIILVPVAY